LGSIPTNSATLRTGWGPGCRRRAAQKGRGTGLAETGRTPGGIGNKERANGFREDNVNSILRGIATGVAAIGCAGLLMTGCKTAPELSKDNAAALIQSHYDGQAPAGVTITVDKPGLQQGLTAGYWKLAKVYPKQEGWADYTVTDAGKKVLKLQNGGDVIEWRPGADGEYHFLIVATTASTMRAKDVQDPQDEILADTKAAKSVKFTESVNLTGLPQPLQDMAHNAGNKLSSKKQADLAYENGAWKVHGII
jgi:hypothetical protein